jgi:hypothetical protein
MLHLDLTSEEHDILSHLLEDALSDLRMEIADTDLFDYREMLKRRKAAIAKVLATMEAQAPVGTAD